MTTSYEFAHRLLPGLVLGNPRTFTNNLFFEGRDELLRQVWANAAPSEQEESGETPEGLRLQVEEHPGFSVGVIKLPPPESVPEAHLVAVVVERAGLGPVEEDRFRGVRYFTLEKGAQHDDAGDASEERTVLCEWTEQRHLNYGNGPPAEEEAFAEEVLRRVRLTAATPAPPARSK